MSGRVTVALAVAGALLAGAAAGLLGFHGDAQASGESSDRGPYGSGTGVTPPAAQGTRVERERKGVPGSHDPSDQGETTSAAEADRGKPMAPGTGVGRVADEERARSSRGDGRDPEREDATRR